MYRAGLLAAVIVIAGLMAGTQPVEAGHQYETLWPDGGVQFAPLIDTALVYAESPLMVSDGDGGSFVVWKRNYCIYAQHVSSDGSILWETDGRMLIDTVYASMRLAADGAGGMIVAWEQPFGYTMAVRAQRFDADCVPQWDEGGVLVYNSQDYTLIKFSFSSDGDGGAVFAILVTMIPIEITRVQRVDSNGDVLWGDEGVQIASSDMDVSHDHMDPRVVSDGLGGAIVAYTNDPYDPYEENLYRWVCVSGVTADGTLQYTRSLAVSGTYALSPTIMQDGYGGSIVSWVSQLGGESSILAQRLDGSGAELWTPGSEEICSGTAEGNSVRIVSDGAGGAIVAWCDNRGTSLDIYGQWIDSGGVQQWTADGEVVCSASNDQLEPRLAPDGSGGAIVSWQDTRSEPYADIYAQHMSSAGIGQWGVDGEIVCDELFDQTSHTTLVDGTGGAVIFWLDYRLMESGAFEVYVQKMDGAGAPQWAADGEVVCEYYQNFQDNVDHVDDGEGGALAVWVEEMGGLFVQRVDSLGLRLWTDSGIMLCDDGWRQDYPRMIPTDDGGAIVTWQDRRNGYNDIFVQRIDAAGNGLWTSNGIGICTDAADQRQPKIVPDGAGGAIVSWYDYRNGHADIFAQRVDGNGAPQWAADGIAVCATSGDQTIPEMIPDGEGGAIIVWSDERYGHRDIFGQRINAGGGPLWMSGGVEICSKPYDQSEFRVVTDGAEGAIVVWQDFNDDDYDVYAQRVNAGGGRVWTVGGAEVCAYDGDQLTPRSAPDGAGGAIVAWIDKRELRYNGEVYVQRLDANGTALWTDGGIYLTTDTNHSNCDIVSDGKGGAIIIWDSFRAQHLNGDAIFLWPTDWANGNGGMVIESSACKPAIVTDGDDGALIAWYSTPYDELGQNVYGQRIVDVEVPSGFGPVLYVDCDAVGLGDGSSWEDAFTDLKQALDTAAVYYLDVDEIWVAEGTYKPTGGTDRSVFFVLSQSHLAMYGGFGGTESDASERNPAEHATVLSGDIGVPGDYTDNSYHVVTTSHTDTTTVIDGFIVRDAYNDYGGNGGGLYAPYPVTLRDMAFIDNIANGYGGGAYLVADGKADLSDIVCEGNVAAGHGGGLFVYSISEELEVDMYHARFSNNSANGNVAGGGLRIAASAPYSVDINLDDVLFENNKAGSSGGALLCYYGIRNVCISNTVFTGNSAGSQGGGLYIYCVKMDISNVEFRENSAVVFGGGARVHADTLFMSNIEFVGNVANNEELIGWGEGGGMSMSTDDHATLTNLEFRDNYAGHYGGGLYMSYGNVNSLYNCVFLGNSAPEGGGMYLRDSYTRVVNASFSQNSGSSCIHSYYGSNLILVNSILWDNEVPADSTICIESDASGTVSYSLVEDCLLNQGGGDTWNELYGVDGGHNLDEDPFFADAAGGDLRLLVGSPAIDAGDKTVAGLPATDILGNPRIIGATVDMGAYEGAVSAIEVTVATDPPGLDVTVAGTSHISPYTFPAMSGTEIEIGTVSPQKDHGIDYCFVEWSDSGDTTHTVTLPDSNVTYTAEFRDYITGIEGDKAPLVNALHQNHPNPFNPMTTISFSLRQRGRTSLAIYDVAGRLVRVLADGVMEAGPQEVAWDGRNGGGGAVASGVYFYRLEAGTYIETKKMVLLR